MNTPSPKYFCPECRSSFSADDRYCGKCGADMHSASGLRHASTSQQIAKSRGKPRSVRPTDDTEAIDTIPKDDADWDGGHERRTTQDAWQGKTIDSRYRVLEIIGSGGMGVVYKVEHLRMGKVAAMKVLHGELAEDPEVIGRFHREAKAVSRLHHPNTVQVFDFGAFRGSMYLIMEYVRGLDLGSLVKRDGAMPFDRAAPLFGQICAALGEAHGLGIVHRDLKPENILVTRTHRGRDFVKVLDFGLAKLSEQESRADVTDRGSIVGTPYYMSPEQIRGDEVDVRSDIYSLGALMYRVLTGEHPFRAKTPIGVLTKHLTAELVPPSERKPGAGITRGIDHLVCRAMEKDAAHRWQTVTELLEEVEQVYVELHSDTAPTGIPGLSWSASATSRVSGAAVISDKIDYGIDDGVRLQRSDLDAFERSLKRVRFVRIAIIPVLLLAVAAAVVYLYVVREQAPQTSEAEPNNERPQATLIETDTEVTGYLGKRVNEAEPDRDYYRLKQRPSDDGKTTATVRLTGLPNMDVELFLLDNNGRRLARANEGGVGHNEIIHRFRVETEVYVLVGQVKADGPSMPIENVSDKYKLHVTLETHSDKPGASMEIEPNNNRSDAVELQAGASVRGNLDRRKDVDVFVFRGGTGKYTLTIGGAAKVPLLWQINDGKAQSTRSKTVTLNNGDTVTLSRKDAELKADVQLPGLADQYVLAIKR